MSFTDNTNETHRRELQVSPDAAEPSAGVFKTGPRIAVRITP